MEREQFLKVPEKSEGEAKEMPMSKPEEIAVPETEVEKFKTELEAEQKAENEKAEFLDKMQKDEQEMAGGILRKVAEGHPRLRKGLMILAAAGVILSAGKAFGGETWPRTHQGWQNTVRQTERMPYQYGVQERQKAEAIQRQYQLKERARFDAYQDYQKQEQAIQRGYEQRKFDIMIGRLPGATDYFSKERAYQELEQWKNNELNRARYDWSLKVWAAEETYRMQSGQARR